ncbi:MAG: alpha/beta fold hydrolase [Caulobacteraceae bacterium]
MGEPAPLLLAPGAAAPGGGSAWWFEGEGRKRLRAALFAPRGHARGSVAISPGRTEAIEKYFETIQDLTRRGWTALVHDWRGQGLSERLLANPMAGHAEGFGDFLADYSRLLDAFGPQLPRPWIGLGHSMGGCLTLLAMARGEIRIDAAVLSAPMLGLATGRVPPAAARLAARLQRLLGLGARLAAPASEAEIETFETNILTHDRARYERNRALTASFPELALGAPTWGWLDSAFSAIGALQRGAETKRIAAPVVIALAGEERLVDNRGARLVASRIPGARAFAIEGSFHEILQETDEARAQFWAQFDALAERVRA